MSERVEAVLRIPLGIICGIILSVWGFVVGVVSVVHWFYVIILGRRHRGISEFANKWVSYIYSVYRYQVFATNKRAWPFGGSEIKEMESVDIPQYQEYSKP